jgi:hypothetical protein
LENTEEQIRKQFKEANVTFNSRYGPSLDDVEAAITRAAKELVAARKLCHVTITAAEKTKLEINSNKTLTPAIKKEAVDVIDGDADDFRHILNHMDAICNKLGWN